MRGLCAFVLISLPVFAADPRLFPLPSPDGKALAATAGQHSFRVPFRFARVEAFYKDRFAHEAKVSLTPTWVEGRHVLTTRSTRAGDGWAKAVVREGDMDTTVEVTPVLRAGDERVEGNGRPLVEIVLTKSAEFDRMVESIDHSPEH